LNLLLHIALAWGAPGCPAPVTPGEIGQLAADARESFARMSAERFAEQVARLEAAVPCLDRQLTPEQAAELHTVRALAAFLESDEVSAAASLQAALAASPELSLDWLPPGHPIFFELRYAARTMVDERRSLRPESGLVVVDGRMVDEVVPDRPAILQHEADGAVLDSALIALGEPLPDWAPLAPMPLSPEVRRRLWLGGAATVSALTSGTLLGLSAQYRETYLRTTDHALLPDLERKTNLTSAGSIAMAGLAAGFGVGLAIAW
jgi:hypothetical protein